MTVSNSLNGKEIMAMTIIRNLMRRVVLTIGVILIALSTSMAQWQQHKVRQLNGKDQQIQLPAKFQIITESWNRVAVVPNIIYMPEKNRLFMLISCDHPHRTFILTSNDRGTNWTNPSHPVDLENSGSRADLAHLGNGNALLI